MEKASLQGRFMVGGGQSLMDGNDSVCPCDIDETLGGARKTWRLILPRARIYKSALKKSVSRHYHVHISRPSNQFVWPTLCSRLCGQIPLDIYRVGILIIYALVDRETNRAPIKLA